jgi:hypothetical protein
VIRRVPDLSPSLRPVRGLIRDRYVFPGLAVAVVSNDIRALSVFRSLYRAFLAPPGERGKGREVRLLLLRQGRKYQAVDPGFPSFVCSDLHRAVAFLSAQVFVNHLFRRSLLFLHAAVVLHRGKALIFCGGSRRGKSTLAVKLERAGWALLSDEFAPLDLRTGRIRAFPRSLLLRERRPGPVFPDWEETDREGRPSPRFLVAPPPFSRSFAVLPGAVFILRGFAPGKTEFRSLSAPRALRLLLDHSVNPGYVRTGGKAAPLSGLVRLLASVPAWSLRPGGRGETPAELAASVARAAGRSPRGVADLEKVAARCAELSKN